MNSKHKNLNFSFETEKDGQVPSLMLACSMRMVSFCQMFTEKKLLVEFT